MEKFKVNDEVVLPANAEEGWPEEIATVVVVQDQKKYPGMYIVQVVERIDFGDDRLREIHEHNMISK